MSGRRAAPRRVYRMHMPSPALPCFFVKFSSGKRVLYIDSPAAFAHVCRCMSAQPSRSGMSSKRTACAAPVGDVATLDHEVGDNTAHGADKAQLTRRQVEVR